MKLVVKLYLVDEKMKQRVMKAVSGIQGLESIAIDSKDDKLTVTGGMDPVSVVERLRKICRADVVSIGPAKEAEKKKEEPKKVVDPAQMLKAYQAYYQNPHYYQLTPAAAPPQYFNRSVEEDPNACVIS